MSFSFQALCQHKSNSKLGSKVDHASGNLTLLSTVSFESCLLKTSGLHLLWEFNWKLLLVAPWAKHSAQTFQFVYFRCPNFSKWETQDLGNEFSLGTYSTECKWLGCTELLVPVSKGRQTKDVWSSAGKFALETEHEAVFIQEKKSQVLYMEYKTLFRQTSTKLGHGNFSLWSVFTPSLNKCCRRFAIL